ncbi:NHL domain-containing protein [Flavipsychrobacter stenotrophus]|nr:T9SS type A sorting domain-containing protein [Flavipsychrobacter stenotrophus]
MKNLISSLSLLVVASCFQPASLHAQTINAFAGNHTSGYSGDGSSALSAQCYAPAGIAVDAAGNVYFCELGNSVIRKVSTSGIISTVAGTGTAGFSGNGGPATAAKINQPTSVAVDDTGNIIFTDDANNMIRKINTSGIISTIAGTGTGGYFGDLGLAVNAQLNSPSGVATDHKGNVFIADVYNHAVRKIDTGGRITTIAGDGSPGYTGNGYPAIMSSLNFPKGVWADSTGNLFIVDQGNSVIRRINTGGVINTYAGCDTPGYSGDGGYGYKAKLNAPTEITTDRSGNLYIADFSNHVIRKVTPGGFISTYAGSGTSGYSGDGGNARMANMAGPYGVAISSNGRMYITDEINNVIRVIDLATGVEQTISLHPFTLNVYPNPSDGAITIEIPATNLEANLLVVDVTGRTVQTRSIAAGNQSIKVGLQGLATGTYFVKVAVGSDIYREKFVVNN